MVSRRSPGALFLAVWLLVSLSSTARALVLTSPEIANGAMLRLAQVHSRCGGENRSPALAWSGAPKGTASYAVTMFDPDADNGRGFWHWLVFDIPPTALGLPADAGSQSASPAGAIQADNDFGTPGYGGACPPPGSGSHHYTLTVYALPVSSLPLDSRAAPAVVATYLKAHALATASLTGIYGR